MEARAEQFWNRWRQNYLQLLQTRNKWYRRRKSIESGDIVLLRDKHSRRNMWPCARVLEVKTSGDGMVRSATVQITRMSPAGGDKVQRVYNRPICELVLLVSRSEIDK